MELDLLLTDVTTFLPFSEHSAQSSDSSKKAKSEKIFQSTVNLGIKDGRWAFVGADTPKAQKTISLKNLTALPGVIDTQVHFRDPGLTHKEDLHTGSRSAAVGGVIAFFEMPNTNPLTLNKKDLDVKLNLAAEKSIVDYAFYMGGSDANSSDISEIERLKHSPGIKVFMGSSTGNLLVDDLTVLEKILSGINRRLVVHCEDEQRLKERKHLAVESANAVTHPLWRDELTGLIATQNLVRIAQKKNKKVHVLHVTSAQEMDFLRAYKKKDLFNSPVTVEVLPQHLTLHAPDCYERLGTYVQQNPPIRSLEHQQALWKAIQDGTVDLLGSDHAPHTREEKDKTYPSSPSGMPATQTMIPLMLTHVNNGRLSLERLVELTSYNAQEIFKIKNKGQIKVGNDADLTIVDMNKKMKIENSWMESRSQWSPFDGYECHGWVEHSLLRGEFVLQNGKITKTTTGRALNFEL